MHTFARLPLVLALVTALGSAACAGETSGEDAAAADQNLTAYDAVVKNGTKVENDTDATPTQSAKTHLVGYLKGRQPATVQKQLMSLGKWTQIKDDQGNQPFTKSRVTNDHTSDNSRTVDAVLTASAGVDITLDAKATTGEDDTRTIHMTNTAASRHWLAGTIIDTGKLVIDVKIVPYKDGTIVDATIKVKLAQMEDKASELTGALPMTFQWLDDTTS